MTVPVVAHADHGAVQSAHGREQRGRSVSFVVVSHRPTAAFLLSSLILIADQVPVRHVEGRIHGFLVIRDMDDKLLASGSLIQLANGSRVTTELSFRFTDGSLHQETTVFSQRRTFQLLTYRLVQRGPAFKRAMDMSLNASTGQ